LRNVALSAEVPLLYENVFGVSPEVSVVAEPYLYKVVVESEPLGVPFRVDGIEFVTPTEFQATKESYTLYFPPTFEDIPFKHWEDGSTEPVRTITVDKDLTLVATYKRPWYKEPWVIGLGIVGGACILTIVLSKAFPPKAKS